MSSTKPRRRLRSLVIFLVVVALLGFAADRAAEAVAENRLAALAVDEAAKYDVRAADTSAEVDGFAFLPQVARGEFSRITLTMQQPTVESIAAEDLNLVMNGIHVPREVLTGGGAGAKITVDTADVHLKVSPAALTKLVSRTSNFGDLSLRIAGSKLQATMTVNGYQASASVKPQAANGRISLLADDLPEVPSALRRTVQELLARGIRVPNLPFNASLQQIAIQGQSITLSATATNLQLAG
ncbi:hypothetical protein GCM10009789_53830 [Kribbella sancticallisti]|uniref:DUF2993 domain-containing protein n=1 Tax=Kribbella sancticallisti TaxID=460087 RepID=A0ABN2E160_9ACTN